MLYFIYRFGNFGKRVKPYWIIIITIIMIKPGWEQEIQDFLHWSNCLFPAYWHCVLSRLSSLNLSFPICKIFKTFNKLYYFISGLDSFSISSRLHGGRDGMYHSVQWHSPQACSFDNMTERLINGSHCVSWAWRGRSRGQKGGDRRRARNLTQSTS